LRVGKQKFAPTEGYGSPAYAWVEAELVRRWGELMRDPPPTIAKEWLREALDIARRQEAKLWELRAAESLALLWGRQGRRTEARDLLARVAPEFKVVQVRLC